MSAVCEREEVRVMAGECGVTKCCGVAIKFGKVL